MGGGRAASLAAAVTIVIIVAVSASLYLGHGASTKSPRVAASSSASSTLVTINSTFDRATVGSVAPDFQVQLTNGTTATLSNFRGHPVLLWFVTIGCSSCEIGAQLLSQQYYSLLHNKGVTILTVQLYDNLGVEGGPFSGFATQFGGAPQGWLFGTSNQTTTYIYDPGALLDIYYALDSQGRIVASGAGLAADLPSVVAAF
jgi:thiol-disulfide isomerase/thioredoxin